MAKPKKPYRDFPLFAHPNGQWAKKIKGRPHYFGVWSKPQEALERYQQERDFLYAGQAPPEQCQTLGEVLEAFKADKQRCLDEGSINERTFGDYLAISEAIAGLGKHRSIKGIAKADLLSLRERLSKGKNGGQISPVTFGVKLTFARMFFKYANEEFDSGVKYTKPLTSPAKKQLRERRNQASKKLFSAEQLRILLKNADSYMRAMILLGINAGFGPADCVALQASDIENGWYDSFRVKTQVPRRCPLWPETVSAVNEISNGRVAFNGRKWTRHIFALQFKSLCQQCEVYREGVTTPYSLRRTFQTIAKTAPVNQSVIDKIMGHERPDMSEVYNQTVFDQELRKCVDHVQGWLKGSITLA